MSEERKRSQSRRVKTIHISFKPDHADYLRRRAEEEEVPIAFIVKRMVEREIIDEQVRRVIRAQEREAVAV